MIEPKLQPNLDNTTLVERIVRKDKAIVILALGLIFVLAGVYTVTGVGMNMSALEMTRMANLTGSSMMMGMQPQWTPVYFLLIVFMWWIMMVAMMTPSAAPTLLLYTTLKRQGSASVNASRLSFEFLAGYLLIWGGFSVVAAFLQWALSGVGLVSGSMMTISSNTFAGIVLVIAGIYQLSSVKTACLKHCRSPVQFLVENNRSGKFGALTMGAHHGFYCLGCCWAVMALLFVGGIMNLYWIAGLAVFVIAEKTIRLGELLAKITGAILILAGGLIILGAVN